MLRQNITLVLSAMRDRACDCEGGLPELESERLQEQVSISYNGQERQTCWDELRYLIPSTLHHGESIWIHCLAGVHRAPVLGGMVISLLTESSLEDSLHTIKQVRAIEPEKVRSRKGGDATSSIGLDSRLPGVSPTGSSQRTGFGSVRSGTGLLGTLWRSTMRRSPFASSRERPSVWPRQKMLGTSVAHFAGLAECNCLPPSSDCVSSADLPGMGIFRGKSPEYPGIGSSTKLSGFCN